jgi:carbon-monoxide dehydrogenase large subunit
MEQSRIDKKKLVGSPVLRREDRRLLRGEGRFVADLELPRMVHAVLVRSPLPHARIKSVDLSEALKVPGVVLAMDGEQLAKHLPPVPDHQVSLPKTWSDAVKHKLLNPRQPLLAVDKVRHVGEAFAVIVAESRYIAEDAARLVTYDLEALSPVTDPEAAVRPGSAIVHEEFGSNAIAEFSVGFGNASFAMKASKHRIKRRFHHHRYGAIPMECRGVVSSYDGRNDTITTWSSTQVVHWVQREIANVLDMPETRVRCLALDVGGGFGVKGHVYPEDLLISFLARQVGRPVRWIEDRHEHLMCSCHSRDQIHDVEFGFDDEGRITAFTDHFYGDCGAWNPIGIAPFYNTAAHLVGPYQIRDYAFSATVVATNKVPSAPYRGAGRPEAVLAVERSMDLIAQTLGLEPSEVRRRNMVRPDQMPYSVGIPYRDGEPIVYDGGDYPGALQKALAAVGGVEAFRKRQADALKEGRYLGLGVACYTEGTGAGPFEGATLRIDRSGTIHVATGACPQGQGMETVYAQMVADAWNVDMDKVVVSLADTSAIAIGFGTIASRSTVTVSGAITYATERLRDKVFAIAANMLECSADDLELRAGKVGVIGVSDLAVSLGDVAKASRPGWDHKRPPGLDAGLEETFYFEPSTVTWAYAVHAVTVEVDVKLCRVVIDKYAIAHDCGVIVNPMLLEGQIIGGMAQGIGGGLLEEFLYDDEGQFLSGSLMDYLLPTASDVPDVTLVHQVTPTHLNPLGVKGVGEGGAIAPPAALANAVSDALSSFKIEFNSTPVTPNRIFAALHSDVDRKVSSSANT